MAATKQIPAAVSDLILNDIATSTRILYTTMTTNPAAAANITGVILSRTVTGTDFTLTSATAVGSSAVIEVEAGATPIAATGTGTATCIICKTGTTATDGVIKYITTGSTVMTDTQNYTPSAFTLTIPTVTP